MAADPLDQVLQLVAEGRLTADEAAPILAALDEAPAGQPGSRAGAGAEPGSSGAFAFEAGSGGETHDADAGSGPSSLRIEVREGGRQVVNLRLPLAVGRFALDRVPGLSGEQVDRVREAMRSGFRGPVLVVDDDGGSGVRIVLE